MESVDDHLQQQGYTMLVGQQLTALLSSAGLSSGVGYPVVDLEKVVSRLTRVELLHLAKRYNPLGFTVACSG